MRREQVLIAALLLTKLLFLAWNAYAFDGEIYDQAHHLWRLRAGGFNSGKMAYNGPLYYLPAWFYPWFSDAGWVAPSATKQGGENLMRLLRTCNIGWLGLFYTSWIYGILPRVTPDRSTWFAASAVLLCLPGYQKVGTLVHPDNLLMAGTAAGFLLWLLLRERTDSPVRGRWEWALVVWIGLLGTVRPFALVPVVLLWAGLMRTSKIGRPWASYVRRAVLYTLVAASLAGSWLAHRAYESNVVLDAYNNSYIKPFEKHREGFEFVPYFTTFHFNKLLERPNRKINKLSRGPAWKNPYGNSFFTIAYSEFWGDHWLYLSGPRLKERKKQAKQRLLIAALPFSFLLGGRFFWGTGWVLTKRGHGERGESGLMMLGMLLAGLLLFLYWQTGAGLLPGKNSTIKFVYNAHLVPFGIALAFQTPVRWPWVWGALAVLITAVSTPYLLFTPITP